jgi:hypothetical protein
MADLSFAHAEHQRPKKIDPQKNEFSLAYIIIIRWSEACLRCNDGLHKHNLHRNNKLPSRNTRLDGGWSSARNTLEQWRREFDFWLAGSCDALCVGCLACV